MIEAATLWDLMLARAAETPDALFAIDESGRRLSFASLRDDAERLAAKLRARGVRSGDAVSWILPTRLDAFVLMLALARLEVVQNPLLPIYRRREVGFCARQTGARWLLVPPRFRGFDYLEMAREVAGEVAGLSILDVEALLAAEPAPPLPPWRAPEPGEPAPVRWVFYTSGTTSAPKGARHTDAAVLTSSAGMVRALDLGPGCRTGVVFPVTHLGGANALASTLQAGSTQLVVEIFDPETTVPFLARHGVTHAGAGPVFYQAYLEAQRAAGPEPIFPALRALYGGGAPTPPHLHEAVREEMGGLGILSTYGMTECPIIAMARFDDPVPERSTTEGRPTHPATRIRVVDADGDDVAPGETGELLVHAPQCMVGFVDAELDREAFDAQGFLRTGDLGRVTKAGYVVLTGRKKDVIIRKGENISALEIESLLGEHPAIAEVAVIGLPDAERGEMCCAVVRLHEGAGRLTLHEVRAHLGARGLMPQKIPERLELTNALPRNASGKVLKAQLRDRYAALTRGDDGAG